MANIKNLTVKAGEKDAVKVTEARALCIVSRNSLDERFDPFISKKVFVIEAVNGRWEFDLDDISYFEFDIETEKRFIHVISRAEDALKKRCWYE